MVFSEIDPRLLSIKSLKEHVQKISRQHYCLKTQRHLIPYTEEKIEQILPAYDLPKETVTAIIMLYRNVKTKVCTADGDTDLFDIVAGILQGDTFALNLFIICLDC